MPARREGLSDGVGVERIRVGVGEVESILGTLGESDRDEPHSTAYAAPDAGIHPSLERGLDIDVEDISLQSASHLVYPLGLELDGGFGPLTVGDDKATIMHQKFDLRFTATMWSTSLESQYTHAEPPPSLLIG